MQDKCAIFNYWWAWSDAHGASLTAFALYKLIEELGYSPCLIMTVFKGIDIEQCRRGRHFRFIEKYVSYSKKNYQTGYEYKELNDRFDHFIVGSDQVLRLEWVPDEWFLYSIKNDKNKIIMSGSFGVNHLKTSKERLDRVKKYLEKFSAVSIREKDGVKLYQQYFGKRADIEWIMDPVFLIDPRYYYKLIEGHSEGSINTNIQKEIVFLYILDNTQETERIKEKILDSYNVIIVEDNENLMAEDFLHIIANCKMVITDSFHGMCFSIIMNKPFYCISNEVRGESRINTLNEVFDLGNIIMESKNAVLCDFHVPEIDYNMINKIIEKERQRGRNWLKHKLERKNI